MKSLVSSIVWYKEWRLHLSLVQYDCINLKLLNNQLYQRHLVEDKNYTKIINKKEQMLNSLESTIQKSILDSISSLFLHTHNILSANQNKDDFCPKDYISPTRPTKVNSFTKHCIF